MSEVAGWERAVVGAEQPGSLFGSELLNAQEASRLLARGPGRLVVWMGEEGTGKTTLSLELYERQRDLGSAARFAGSRTLLAFERLAHHRRATGAPPPATRSELDPEGRELLHLALTAAGSSLHLLLADLPGEVFRRLADNQIAATDIPWLRRADKLVLLVDGQRLCDAGQRSSTLVRVRQLLERLQAVLPSPETRLALLVTKWDLVRADFDAVSYWEHRERELLQELRSLDPQAPALRAATGAGPRDDAIADLRAWLLEVSDAPAVAVAEPLPVAWTQPVPEQVARPAPQVAAPAFAPEPVPEVQEQQPHDEGPIESEPHAARPTGFEWPIEEPARFRLPWRRRR